MTSIDPNFTLGLIEAERNALLRRLAESGQLRANGLLPRPQLPLRIALITSRGSAAEADFCEELARYGYGFRVTSAPRCNAGNRWSSSEYSVVTILVAG